MPRPEEAACGSALRPSLRVPEGRASAGGGGRSPVRLGGQRPAREGPLDCMSMESLQDAGSRGDEEINGSFWKTAWDVQWGGRGRREGKGPLPVLAALVQAKGKGSTKSDLQGGAQVPRLRGTRWWAAHRG